MGVDESTQQRLKEFLSRDSLVITDTASITGMGSSAFRNMRGSDRSGNRTDVTRSGRENGVESPFTRSARDEKEFHREPMDITEQSFDSLIDRMRSSTFNVKIRDVFDDVISPMHSGLKKLQLEHHEFLVDNGAMDTRYLTRIYETLLNIKSANTQSNGSIKSYLKSIAQHPALRAMTMIGKTFAFIGKGFFSLLFGGKKKKSTEEKILKAIEEQTEFLRTGSIDRERGLFQRFREGGLLGGIVSNTFGRSLDNRAQKTEEKMARGEDVGFLEKRIWSSQKDVIKSLGRQGGIIGDHGKDQSGISDNNRDEATLKLSKEIGHLLKSTLSGIKSTLSGMKSTLSGMKSTLFGDIVPEQMSEEKKIGSGKYGALKNLKGDQEVVKSLDEHLSSKVIRGAFTQAVNDSDLTDEARKTADGNQTVVNMNHRRDNMGRLHDSRERRHWRNVVNMNDDTISALEAVESANDDIVSEHKKTRRFMFFRSILSGIGRIAGFAAGIAGAITGLGSALTGAGLVRAVSGLSLSKLLGTASLVTLVGAAGYKVGEVIVDRLMSEGLKEKIGGTVASLMAPFSEQAAEAVRLTNLQLARDLDVVGRGHIDQHTFDNLNTHQATAQHYGSSAAIEGRGAFSAAASAIFDGNIGLGYVPNVFNAHRDAADAERDIRLLDEIEDKFDINKSFSDVFGSTRQQGPRGVMGIQDADLVRKKELYDELLKEVKWQRQQQEDVALGINMEWNSNDPANSANMKLRFEEVFGEDGSKLDTMTNHLRDVSRYLRESINNQNQQSEQIPLNINRNGDISVMGF